MKLTPVTRIGPDATPTAAPSVTIGDAIYYRHKARGIAHGTVAAVGRHGVTTDSEGEEHQVAWDQYLGHRQRATRRLTIVDRGEDGSIMEDEDGQRVYVRGSLSDYLPETKEDPDDSDDDAQMPLAKAAGPLLIDIGALDHGACDCALETLHKAMAEAPREPAIWRPHENPFLTDLVEQFSAAGSAALQEAQDALFHAMGQGEPVPLLRKAGLWDDAHVAALRKRLAKPIAEYTAADWVDLVDLIFHTRLPHAVQVVMAAGLQLKARVAGYLQAIFDAAAGAYPLGGLVAAMGRIVAGTSAPPPDTLFQIPRAEAAAQEAVMDVAKARIGINLQAMTDAARARVSRTILAHIEAHGTAQTGLLQQKLFDDFGEMNRDWRRIAVTEAGEVANQAYLSQFPSGTRVKRIEMYEGACSFCRHIDGMVFEWSDKPRPDSDGWTHVWPGKTNVGRSASPRKKTDEGLVERLPSELWWPAAGVQHPHCFVSPDVPVYAVDGWRRIADIKVGDSVLTHRGRFRQVNWVLEQQKYTGDVVSFDVVFKGKNKRRTPGMTPEHPVLTNLGWVPAGDIQAGDEIVSLAKKCPTCGDLFVNMKFPNVVYCGNACIPKSGKNQFSTDDPLEYAYQVNVTREKNTERMRGMTVEQRRALTASGRAVMEARGYAHLGAPEGRRKGAVRAASLNYTPSTTELLIAESLKTMGVTVALQHRVKKGFPDSRGRLRYWWLDLAIPGAKVAAEIDGEPWHGRLSSEGRDEQRDADLNASGWTVLRFSSVYAKNNPHMVADSMLRLAMNHDGQYEFSSVAVHAVSRVKRVGVTIYNFGVEEDESYVVRGGLVVHNCRGRWIAQPSKVLPPGVDPKFAAWLDQQIADLPPVTGQRQ